MKIAAIYAGAFGEQILNTLGTSGFADRIIFAYELRPEMLGDPAAIGRLWEDPESFVPRDYPSDQADLILILGVHGALADLLPALALRTGARAVLYAIDDRDCAPAARRTIEEECRAAGIQIEFAMPLCSLAESPDPCIAEFAAHFGRPVFRIQTDLRDGTIRSVDVIRDTPCGTASAIAKVIPGLSTRDPAGLARRCFEEHHSENADHTCLAEMDPLCPLMQEAADILKDAVFSACGLPTLRDLTIKRVEGEGSISLESLAEGLIDTSGRFESGTVGCLTRRALDRVVAELEEEGLVTPTPAGELVLPSHHAGGSTPK